MKLWQNFLSPKTISEGLQALATAPSARIIAGGTDLMLDLQQGHIAPVHTLVDITSIPALTRLEVLDGALFVGAAVPVARLAEAELTNEHAAALVDACRLIAGPQVRNVATLGGNVAHALPAADGTIALMCLDVQAEVANLHGNRRVPFHELFAGPGKTALRSGEEMLVGLHIPLRQAGQASAFRRVMRTQGIALPILNLSVWLERKEGHITALRLACGPSGPTPRRLVATEAILCGQAPEAKVIEQALATMLEEVTFRTSPRRATVDYRRALAGVLLKDTLESAWQRAEI